MIRDGLLRDVVHLSSPDSCDLFGFERSARHSSFLIKTVISEKPALGELKEPASLFHLLKLRLSVGCSQELPRFSDSKELRVVVVGDGIRVGLASSCSLTTAECNGQFLEQSPGPLAFSWIWLEPREAPPPKDVRLSQRADFPENPSTFRRR